MTAMFHVAHLRPGTKTSEKYVSFGTPSLRGKGETEQGKVVTEWQNGTRRRKSRQEEEAAGKSFDRTVELPDAEHKSFDLFGISS